MYVLLRGAVNPLTGPQNAVPHTIDDCQLSLTPRSFRRYHSANASLVQHERLLQLGQATSTSAADVKIIIPLDL